MLIIAINTLTRNKKDREYRTYGRTREGSRHVPRSLVYPMSSHVPSSLLHLKCIPCSSLPSPTGVVQHFNDTMKNDPQVIGPSTAVVAIQSLLKLIKESKGRQACRVPHLSCTAWVRKRDYIFRSFESVSNIEGKTVVVLRGSNF